MVLGFCSDFRGQTDIEYASFMAAQIGQMLSLRIDSERELNVINDGKGRRTKFVLQERHSESYQVREEFYLSSGDCMKLSMYLAGIRDAMRQVDLGDFDEEDTTPVEIPKLKKDDDE